jgi:hypothetical protein
MCTFTSAFQLSLPFSREYPYHENKLSTAISIVIIVIIIIIIIIIIGITTIRSARLVAAFKKITRSLILDTSDPIPILIPIHRFLYGFRDNLTQSEREL